MRKVLVDKNGLVVNAIEIEDGSDWQLPNGYTLLDENNSKVADIGDKLSGSQLIKPAYLDRDGKLITPEPIEISSII